MATGGINDYLLLCENMNPKPKLTFRFSFPTGTLASFARLLSFTAFTSFSFAFSFPFGPFSSLIHMTARLLDPLFFSEQLAPMRPEPRQVHRHRLGILVGID